MTRTGMWRDWTVRLVTLASFAILAGWAWLVPTATRLRDETTRRVDASWNLTELRERQRDLFRAIEAMRGRPAGLALVARQVAACRKLAERARVEAVDLPDLRGLLGGVVASIERVDVKALGIDESLAEVRRTILTVTGLKAANAARIKVLWREIRRTWAGGLAQGSVVVVLLLASTALIRIDADRCRAVEERVRASEQHHRTIYQEGPLAFITWDPSCRLLDWNRRAEDLFGWSREEVAGRSFLDFAVPESGRGEVAGLVAGILRGETPERVVLPVLTKGGDEILCEWHSAPLRDAAGRVTSVISSALDVTGRERSVEALRRSESRFRRVFETSLVGLAVSRADGSVVEVNDALLAMIGYIRADHEAGAIPWSDLTPPEYAPLDDRGRRDLEASGAFAPFDKEYVRKDGARVPVRLAGTTLDVEEGARVKFILDLTGRREAEARDLASRRLVESIRRAQLDFIDVPDLGRVLGSLLDSLLGLTASPYGFIAEVLRDDEGQPYLAARTIAEIAWDAAGRDRRDAGPGYDMTFKDLSTLFGAVVATGRPVIANAPEADPRRGVQPPVHSFLGLPFALGETLLGVVGIANRPGGYCDADVAYLEPLLTTCAHLVGAHRDEVRRRRAEADLQAAVEAAECADRAKDRFLDVISHELRTPLTPVLAAVTAGPGPADPAVRDVFAMIRRNVEIEARLIDDLIDLTRLTGVAPRFEPGVVDVHAEVRLVIDDARAEAEAAGLAVEVDLSAGACHVEFDRTRLCQVFRVLVGNAMKFTPAGGKVSVRSRDEPGPGGPRLVVEVADTGVGLAPDDLARIFRAFEQVETPTRRRASGMGLGLAIGRSVVEAHGGSLSATSPGPGRGSVFSLALPTVPAPEPAAPPPTPCPPALSPAPAAVPAGLDVLLVEDNKDTLHYLTLALRQSGDRVHPAATLAAAIAAAEAGPIDLVVSDIELPDGTGLDLVRHLRATMAPPPPAIAMSGFGSEEDVDLSLDAGFLAHLTKPVDFRRLRAAMAEAVAASAPPGSAA